VTARQLEGRTVAAALRARAAERLALLVERAGHAPTLAIVCFDTDGPSAIYAASVSRAASRVGIEPRIVTPHPGEATHAVVARIDALGRDPSVAGIVVSQPIPVALDAGAVIAAIDPGRDVDGATPTNAGHLARGEPAPVPATALAVMELLRAYDIPVAGRRVVVVGRSPVIGRPVASLLVAADATVTICHRATRDLASETRRAEILVVAAGSPGLISADMVSPGSVVVDCGISTVDGTVRGDVAPDVATVAGAVSPVPGGIGPVTAMVLVEQTLDAAERLEAAGIAGADRTP
jgi:methylenetetrahydrofolate dehydrogenase (NADP+) / methenyltetrahydrofolate cyclohydrolase